MRSVTSASSGDHDLCSKYKKEVRVLIPITAVTTQALRAVITSGTGRAALSVGKTLAGKSRFGK